LTHVVEPFPFFTITPIVNQSTLVPSAFALEKLTGEGKHWDYGAPFNNNGWQFDVWDWTDQDDSYSPYRHDEKGRLIRYDSYGINWQ
jgi:hypothetical protein